MKRLLVALDGSERAPRVLAAAAQLAELARAKLVLYRAIAVVPDVPRDALSDTDRPPEVVLRSNAHNELDRLAVQVAPSLIEQLVTDLAIAWDGILRIARELDADLIVIGSHGYGGIDRLLGTTAAKVVNHADRNVLVVRTAL